ncbi:MAG TPA: PAS domain-containing protein [Puia sp.]|nr:PAS domain-containing protein [Puia sp.]
MTLKLLSNMDGSGYTVAGNGFQSKLTAEPITNGFFKVDRAWKVKYWNPAAEKLLGVRAKDMLGVNIWEKFSAIIPPSFFTAWHKAFLQDVPVHFEEYWAEKKAWFDVITYHFDDTLSVSFKSSSQPAHSQHPAHPKQQLKILNELYRFVAEVTNDCLWEWDLQSKVLFWIDGGHKRVFGYPIENTLIPQRFWESLVHPDDKELVLAKLNKIVTERSDPVWEVEYRFKKADGEYAHVQDRGHLFYGKEKGAVRMIGATQDITARKLLEKKLAQECLSRQKEISIAVLKAQEKERSEIGKELHDNLNQVLSAAKLYIEMARTDEESREICLAKSSGYIVEVIEEIRRISKTLATPGMVIGLFDSVENLLHDVEMTHPIKVEFQKETIDENELDQKIQLTIFRIVQEQLSNIIKHAKATEAIICLTRRENDIILDILDNGIGCHIGEETNGVGIINIRSRAELYHGSVSTVSSPGKGYRLEVVLPMNYG